MTEASSAAAQQQQLGLRRGYWLLQFARICVLAGKPNDAVDRLEEVLRQPDFYTRGWLKIDPTLAPLRGNPRFDVLTR